MPMNTNSQPINIAFNIIKLCLHSSFGESDTYRPAELNPDLNFHGLRQFIILFLSTKNQYVRQKKTEDYNKKTNMAEIIATIFV